MKYTLGIVVGLIVVGASTGGYYLGKSRTETRRIAALEAEIEELSKLIANRERLMTTDYTVEWQAWKKLDPIMRKHRIIAYWYANQDIGNYYVGLETGHKWGPVWNRRNPLGILEEQTRVMKGFLATLWKLEKESVVFAPGYPPPDTKDPKDGSTFDYENFLESGNDNDRRRIWFGRTTKAERWMVWERDKGIYEPDAALLKRITDAKKADEAEQSYALEMANPGDLGNSRADVDPFAPPKEQPKKPAEPTGVDRPSNNE